ncbi:MAG TPA: hypothetical protein VK811_08725 [Candidatus Acidoferrum sp.]|nr:hypothetical protein [Candidatus Acidoferrum sp.]
MKDGELTKTSAVNYRKLLLLRHQRRELAGFGVVGEEFGGGDFEEPAVQPQRAIGEA